MAWQSGLLRTVAVHRAQKTTRGPPAFRLTHEAAPLGRPVSPDPNES